VPAYGSWRHTGPGLLTLSKTCLRISYLPSCPKNLYPGFNFAFYMSFGSSHAPLTSRLDKDFGPLPPIVCLFLPSDFLLLDVAPFLSMVHNYIERFTFWHYPLTVSADTASSASEVIRHTCAIQIRLLLLLLFKQRL